MKKNTSESVLQKAMAPKHYRGFTIFMHLEESKYEATHPSAKHSVKFSKYNLNKMYQAIDEYWESRGLNFPTAEEMGIKKGDIMFTPKGHEVVIVSTLTVPLTRNQIVAKSADGHSFYICADALHPKRGL